MNGKRSFTFEQGKNLLTKLVIKVGVFRIVHIVNEHNSMILRIQIGNADVQLQDNVLKSDLVG